MSIAEISNQQPALSLQDIQQATDIAVAAIQANYMLRAPRTPEQHANAFAVWLEQWQTKFKPIIVSALRRDAPAIFAQMKDDVLAEVVVQQIWPYVVPFLQSYAVMYQAGQWGRKHFGDATTYHQPVQDSHTWRVQIGIAGKGENLGEIVLDRDGNVLEALTSTREQLLEKLRDNQLSSAATATGQ